MNPVGNYIFSNADEGVPVDYDLHGAQQTALGRC